MYWVPPAKEKKGFGNGGNIDEVRSLPRAQVRSIVSPGCKRKSTDLVERWGMASSSPFSDNVVYCGRLSGQVFGCISGDAALAVVWFPCQTMRRSAVEKRVLVFPG